MNLAPAPLPPGATPPPFARCRCGSFSLKSQPVQENTELYLSHLYCGRCGHSPHVCELLPEPTLNPSR
jgi:hypothetical protein